MAEETQYTANTGMVNITTANSNLSGTGTLGTVLTAAANGTLVKRVFIKATTSVTQGMVRFYVTGPASTKRLIKEVEVPAVTASSIDTAYEAEIDMDLTLTSGLILYASTEIAESFNIIAEGMNWAYYATSVRTDTTQYTAVTGIASITTATTKVILLTAGSNGCSVESITIKSEGSTADGIVALYIYDGTSYFLFKEIKVTAVTRSTIANSYEYNLVFDDDFELKAGYSLYVATLQTQTFSVIAEGLNWAYPA